MPKTILAMGSDIDSAFCIMEGKDYEIYSYPEKASEAEKFILEKIGSKKPDIIVCDKHPEYDTIKIANDLAEKFKAKIVTIQHHKAHVASAAFEHNLSEYVGIAMDGLGYGDDENIWGGEVFLTKNYQAKRVGHLEYQKQLGDAATMHPKKMLIGILLKFLDKEEILKLDLLPESIAKLCINAIKQDFNTFLTSSTGRVLDSVSALLGFCDVRTYGGEPSIVLEKNASQAYGDIEPKIVEEEDSDCKVLQTTPLFQYLLENMDKDKSRLAGTAHIYLAKGIYEIAKEFDLPIVFSGGVAYNKIISNYFSSKGVLLYKEIQPGDKGLCYGQARLAQIQEEK